MKRRSRLRPSHRSKTRTCSTAPSLDSSSRRKCCSNWWVSFRISSTFAPISHSFKDSIIWHFTPSIGCSTIRWCHLKCKSKPRHTNSRRWTCLSKIRILTSRPSSDLRSLKASKTKKERRMDLESRRERIAMTPSSLKQLLLEKTIDQQEKEVSTMLPRWEATQSMATARSRWITSSWRASSALRLIARLSSIESSHGKATSSRSKITSACWVCLTSRILTRSRQSTSLKKNTKMKIRVKEQDPTPTARYRKFRTRSCRRPTRRENRESCRHWREARQIY